jgi:hypothetical protein
MPKLALYSLMIVHRMIPHAHRQEPPRPPSPEPTIAVYENITNPEGNHHHHQKHHHHDHDPNLTSWNTISVRLVGSHPLWGHYLYVQFFFTWDTHQRTRNRMLNLISFVLLFFFFLNLGGTPRARWPASFNVIRSSI